MMHLKLISLLPLLFSSLFANAQLVDRCSVSIENTTLQNELQPIFIEVKNALKSKKFKLSVEGGSQNQISFQIRYTDMVGQDLTRSIKSLNLPGGQIMLGYVSLIFKFKNIQTDETLFYTAQSGLIQVNGFYERYMMALTAQSYSEAQIQNLYNAKKITQEQYRRLLEARSDNIIEFISGLSSKALQALPSCKMMTDSR